MMNQSWKVGVVLAVVLAAASPAGAADKAHQQLMAEIRMLQEQQQQLQQMMGALADTLKTVSTKIDDQTATNRKAFADQKVQIDNVAEGVRILREKADDTNVRLSSVTQELEAVRQAISTMPSQSAGVYPGGAQTPGATDMPPGTAGGGAGVGQPPAPGGGSVPVLSAQRLF